MYRIILKLADGWSAEDAREALRRSMDAVVVHCPNGGLEAGSDDRKPPDARTATQIIRLDASRWTILHDFYDALLPALGAPDWHGRNVNALVESIVWGEINSLEPPFRVEVTTTSNCAADILQELAWIVEGTRSAKADFARRWGYEPDVSFEVLS